MTDRSPTETKRLGMRDDDGVAATDALVALLILSTTLALALAGVTTARHLTEVASETSEAAQLARMLSARGGDGQGRSSGRVGRFTWRMGQSPIPSRTELCARELMLKSDSDQRTYRLASAGECG